MKKQYFILLIVLAISAGGFALLFRLNYPVRGSRSELTLRSDPPLNRNKLKSNSPVQLTPSTKADITPVHSVRLRVLTWHHVADPPHGQQDSYYVRPTVFAAQLQYLADQGYHTITPDQFVSSLQDKKSDEKAVLLTFDDGDEDQFINAYPLLKEYHFTGTFFIISHKLGLDGYMTPKQVVEMDQNSMVIGAHSRTHPNLAKIAPEQQQSEILGSKQDLEQLLGHSVNSFAYPGGAQNEAVRSLVRQAHFQSAFGIHHSIDHDPTNLYNIDRVHIFSSCFVRFMIQLWTL